MASVREMISDTVEDSGPSSYELAILSGLQRKQVYGGTVDPVTVSERRAANRRARANRRINRKRGKGK
jgi:hypothetical protein